MGWMGIDELGEGCVLVVWWPRKQKHLFKQGGWH